MKKIAIVGKYRPVTIKQKPPKIAHVLSERVSPEIKKYVHMYILTIRSFGENFIVLNLSYN